MRWLAILVAALGILGCGGDEPGANEHDPLHGPTEQPVSCEELRCGELDCTTDGELARCLCPPGSFGADCHPCEEGTQDWDDDGVCAPDCLTAALACGMGWCDDISGTARCSCPEGNEGEACERCTIGYQDHDGDGLCTLSCALAEIECAHGACDDATGSTLCACEPDWAGERCDMCAQGLQDYDFDEVCLPDCRTAALECGRGECVDASGVARCACFAGWEGENCDRCKEGLQDEDGDGICEPLRE
ncbi:hypothetical protein [Vulgatibacter sp.]|uniref:hypothetical protein n=1 Tax=Vulgatibacter sp. TaxID=1971226 RepID=UPI00356297F7